MTRTEYNRAVDHFSDGVYRFILKMCKSKEMAEDVVQDSFMKLWEEVGHIAYDKAKSFLFSTAYHRMIDVLRRETKFGDIETVADRAGEVREEYTGLQEILNMALEKLPPVQKTVILLRDYEAYSYGEIAGITGLNESQVKVYIFRRRYDNERELRDLFHGVHGWELVGERTGRGGGILAGSPRLAGVT